MRHDTAASRQQEVSCSEMPGRAAFTDTEKSPLPSKVALSRSETATAATVQAFLIS